MVEALAIGLLGALIGIGGGFLVAMLLNALLEPFGIDLPTTGLVMEQRTIVVSLLVGVVVTVFSSLVPALRSTRVPPIAALQAYTPPATRRRRLVFAVVSVLLGLAGLAMVLLGLFGSAAAGTAAGLIGGGAVVIVFAVSLFSPRLVPPARGRRRLAAGAVATPARAPGARERPAQPEPHRGHRGGADDRARPGHLRHRLRRRPEELGRPGSRRKLRRRPGDPEQRRLLADPQRRRGCRTPGARRRSVATIRSAQAKLIEKGGALGAGAKVSAPTPEIGEAVKIEWKQGGPGDAARPLRRPGDPLRLLRLRTRPRSRRQLPSAEPDADAPALQGRRRVLSSKLDVFGSVLVTQAGDWRATSARPRTRSTSSRPNPAPIAAAVQAVLTRGAEAAFPTAEVLNQQELKESREEQVDQLVNLVYALLALAILISLFGIANTLALSIHERTRELGMLRAIGMSRRQVRTMIRYEAVITALIGAILGMVLGLIFAALIAQPLKDEGFTLSYPVGSLVVLLVLSALAGVLAAIAPARRASRLDVLESLQYE